MNQLIEFRSDWSVTLQKAWDWFTRVRYKSPDEWTSSDWRRLVDLCRLSGIPETEVFHTLGEKLRREKCMPDRRTLIRVGRWKAYGRIERRLSENRDAKVARTSRMAFEIVNQDDSIKGSIEAIRCLRDGIKGLGIPMASVILTMYDPLNFGVIDRLVWSTLFDKKPGQITSYRQWGLYLCKIRRLAKLHRMECREMDASLWFVGSLNARSRRLENT